MTREINPRNLSRGQREKFGKAEDFRGSFEDLAEEIVAEEYGLKGTGDDDNWWDLRHPDRPTKYQVKSTETRIGDKYPADGRFRIWESQMRSMVGSDARGAAWYAFVLWVPDDGKLYIQRRKPGTVLQIINDRGGFNKSGHANMKGQHKLPWHEVF